jgi:TM2 domain-containing membrane protein YozV
MRATTADRAQPAITTYLLCAAGWFIPGLGHLWLGRRRKGLTFLVALAFVADLGIGLPYFIAKSIGAGAGRVVAITYEYGNAFVIVAGLLNMLVVLDAFDIAKGRK